MSMVDFKVTSVKRFKTYMQRESHTFSFTQYLVCYSSYHFRFLLGNSSHRHFFLGFFVAATGSTDEVSSSVGMSLDVPVVADCFRLRCLGGEASGLSAWIALPGAAAGGAGISHFAIARHSCCMVRYSVMVSLS